MLASFVGIVLVTAAWKVDRTVSLEIPFAVPNYLISLLDLESSKLVCNQSLFISKTELFEKQASLNRSSFIPTKAGDAINQK